MLRTRTLMTTLQQHDHFRIVVKALEVVYNFFGKQANIFCYWRLQTFILQLKVLIIAQNTVLFVPQLQCFLKYFQVQLSMD